MVGLATAHLDRAGCRGCSEAGVEEDRVGPTRPRYWYRIDHRGRLRDHRLAGGLDDPRGVADDEQGRLGLSTDFEPLTDAS
jgi:hypothetical protein